MDLFEHAEETRQQRLALTWSGKNEGEESQKVLLTKPAPQDTPSEDEANDIEDVAQQAEANSVDIMEDPMAEPQMETYEDPDTEEQPKPIILKSASIKLTASGVIKQEPPADVDDSIIDELAETVLDDSNPILEEPEPVEVISASEAPQEFPTNDVDMDDDGIIDDVEVEEVQAEVDAEAEEIEATVEADIVDDVEADVDAEPIEEAVGEDDDTVEEVIAATELTDDVTEDEEPEPTEAVGHEEGATTSMLAINPVELNNEFEDVPMQEKETLKMDTPEPESPAPKPLKIARPAVAVLPEPDEDDESIMVATAKPDARPSLKLTVPVETNTNVLKPKKAATDNNTCKLVAESSEIVADSLGGKLRAAREVAGLTEFELAEKTRISSEYITALENEDFGNLPLAPIYIKSYLKTLSRQFGLNAEEMIESYEEKTGALKAKPAKQEPEKTESAAEKKPAKPMPKWLNWGLAAAAAVITLLAVAGIMVNKYGFGKMDENALAVISEEHLENTIKDEFLEIRHMEIPQNETAAVIDR